MKRNLFLGAYAAFILTLCIAGLLEEFDSQSWFGNAWDIVSSALMTAGIFLYWTRATDQKLVGAWKWIAWLLLADFIVWLVSGEFEEFMGFGIDIPLDLLASCLPVLLLLPAMAMNFLFGYPAGTLHKYLQASSPPRIVLVALAIIAVSTPVLRGPALARVVYNRYIRPIEEYSGRRIDADGLRAIHESVEKSLPNAYLLVESNLGLRSDRPDRILIRYRDRLSPGGLTGKTKFHWISGGFGAVILLAVDSTRLDDEVERKTLLAHELTHAIMTQTAPLKHRKLPKWLREGFAVYASDDVDTRLETALTGAVFARKPTNSVCDGWENGFEIEDYAEAGVAVDYLARQVGREGLKVLVERILTGADWEQEITLIAMREYGQFVQEAREDCRTRLGTFDRWISYFEWAYHAYSQGNATEAIRRVDSLLEDSPPAGIRCNAWYLKGKVFLRQGSYQHGRDALNWVLANCNSYVSFSDDSAIRIADSYYEQSDWKSAVEAYEAFLVVPSDQTDWIERASLHLGRSLFELGRYKDAIPPLNRVAAGSANYEAEYWLASSQLALGHTNEAIPILRRLGGTDVPEWIRLAASDRLAPMGHGQEESHP